MKKTYEAPSVEKIAFMYRDQVVAASGGAYEKTCVSVNTNQMQGCTADIVVKQQDLI